MIHIIYIYFIINAFIVGERLIWEKRYSLLYYSVFGTMHYVVRHLLVFLYVIRLFIEQKTWIVPFIRLWLTNHYGNKEKIRIDFCKKRLKEGSYLERAFIKQMDKKYSYGIIEREATL